MFFSERTGLQKLLLLKAAACGNLVEDTATGNPVTFETDVSKALKSLLIPFTPKQTGSGDPSPSNIRPIVPWNGLTVFGGGKNLLNVASENVDRFSGTYTYSEGAIYTDVVGTGNSNYVVFKQKYPAGTYVFSCSVSGGVSNANLLLDIPVSGWEYVSYYGGYVKATNAGTLKFTASEDFNIGVIMRTGTAGVAGAIENIQLEVGQTATAHEPYKPITETDISFPSPVYGGKHEAVSGRLTDGWKTETFDGSSDELWNFTQVGTSAFYRAYIRISDIAQDNDVAILADKYKAVSFDNRPFSQKVCMATNKNESPQYVSFITDETTVEAFKAWLAENPVTIAYMTATPQEIQLTPSQITALIGNNTIWSDADGTMTAIYYMKG